MVWLQGEGKAYLALQSYRPVVSRGVAEKMSIPSLIRICSALTSSTQ